MAKSHRKTAEPLEDMVRYNRLMDLYGELLTDRQRQMLRMHYEEDMSYSEIAEDQDVTRQAAHDAVKHARMSLEKYEERLALMAKLGDGAASRTENEATLGDASMSATAIDRLRALRAKVRRSGVIYSTDWIVDELDGIVETLGDEREGG